MNPNNPLNINPHLLASPLVFATEEEFLQRMQNTGSGMSREDAEKLLNGTFDGPATEFVQPPRLNTNLTLEKMGAALKYAAAHPDDPDAYLRYMNSVE